MAPLAACCALRPLIVSGALTLALYLAALLSPSFAQAGENLLPDPSIEQTQPKNQFGIPYALWSGWIFEGSPSFENGRVARTGETCAEIIGARGGRIRLFSPEVTLEPGRYRFSCYLRALDVGVHEWGLSSDLNIVGEEFIRVDTSGTYGWRRLETVVEVPAVQTQRIALGLWAEGHLWVDDAELVRVGDDTPLTEAPVLGPQEAPIEPPGLVDLAEATRCPVCGYRNMPEWGRCYACGAEVSHGTPATSGPDTRLLASFEEGTIEPFDGGAIGVVAEHATDGRYALRIDGEYASWDAAQDWTGYDFLVADVYNPSDEPAPVYVELRDQGTTGYWDRVNHNTVAPPGASTLIVPADQPVGEKSRPGRPLDKAHVTRVVFAPGDPPMSLYLDAIRLERDGSDRVRVPGLQAYDFGPPGSPPLRGFTRVSPETVYTPGRGYGLREARVWRAFDALQPDPLYQTFVCIEDGEFVTDLAPGAYHVFLNLDSPSGYWGEYQVYRERVVRANGVEVVHDTMDLDRFLAKYFRFAEVEDRPEESAFDKYQDAYFDEKEFDVEVTDGQLALEFEGQNWANALSALVIYPASEAEAGAEYLANLRERRRFHFDNAFKRVLPDPHRDARGVVPAFEPTDGERHRGFVPFVRDWMEDVPYNAVPRREEVVEALEVFASAGEMEPIVFSVHGLSDCGEATVAVSDLAGPGGASVPASSVRLGVVSHRVTRVTADGGVYTIKPRLIMPRSTVQLRASDTATFWLTLEAPPHLEPGVYKGMVMISTEKAGGLPLTLSVRLFATPLDELDVAAGPWGSTIDLPWYEDDLGDRNRDLFRRSLARLREYGCTSFSGIPTLTLTGWDNGTPIIDFSRADWEMAEARAAGFEGIVVNYNGGVRGFDNYWMDLGAMGAAGFDSYGEFLRPILAAVGEHAREADWLPFALNLCDEPIGADIERATENALAWKEAAPLGILTTGATSVSSADPDDAHLALAKALHIANVNVHSEEAVAALKAAGGDWAFYNEGNRWTFGAYMFKCARERGMRFRLSWHWNNAAGDPYYALDCREDDYAWCVTNAAGELVPWIGFERDIREGIDDYRYMLTLARLVKEHPTHPAAEAGRRLLEEKLSAFELGDRSHDSLWPTSEFRTYRLQLAEAIEALAE